jgi:hypothetical protein
MKSRHHAISAKKWARQLGFLLSASGTASDYIRQLAELATRRPGLKVVLYLRKSLRDSNGSLFGQERQCRKRLRVLGVTIIAVFREVGPGWDFDLADRYALVQAVRCAMQHEAIVVAESTSRFIRSFEYSNKNQHACPRKAEYEALRKLTQGVVLATIHHPDEQSRVERGRQTKRGKDAKGNRGGRPGRAGYKKRRRLKLRDRVLAMRAGGLSLNQIVTKTGVPNATIRRWLIR